MWTLLDPTTSTASLTLAGSFRLWLCWCQTWNKVREHSPTRADHRCCPLSWDSAGGWRRTGRHHRCGEQQRQEGPPGPEGQGWSGVWRRGFAGSFGACPPPARQQSSSCVADLPARTHHLDINSQALPHTHQSSHIRNNYQTKEPSVQNKKEFWKMQWRSTAHCLKWLEDYKTKRMWTMQQRTNSTSQTKQWHTRLSAHPRQNNDTQDYQHIPDKTMTHKTISTSQTKQSHKTISTSQTKQSHTRLSAHPRQNNHTRLSLYQHIPDKTMTHKTISTFQTKQWHTRLSAHPRKNNDTQDYQHIPDKTITHKTISTSQTKQSHTRLPYFGLHCITRYTVKLWLP